MEQRKRARYRIWLPLQVRTEAREVMAVTYDASDKGVLMLAPEPIAVGTRVTVSFVVPGETPRERTATGSVVRSGPNDDDPYGLWSHRLAVALDEPIAGFQAELEVVARAHPIPFSKG